MQIKLVSTRKVVLFLITKLLEYLSFTPQSTIAIYKEMTEVCFRRLILTRFLLLPDCQCAFLTMTNNSCSKLNSAYTAAMFENFTSFSLRSLFLDIEV